jgi:hypothetical protein
VVRPAPFVAVSLGLTIAAAVCLLVCPVYVGLSDGRPTRATLLQVNGEWAVMPVAFPVMIAVLPLAFIRQAVRTIAAVVMSAFALVVMSIGLFYLPAAILMILAACLPDSNAPETSH